MKNYLLSILFLTAFNLSAQDGKNHSYLNISLEIGNHLGFDLNYNYVYQDKYSFAIGYLGQISEPENEPSDYNPFFDLFSTSNSMGNLYLLGGKIFNFNKKGSSRLNFLVGIGRTRGTKIENWKRGEKNRRGYDYTYDRNKVGKVSLIINPRFEFPFFKAFGLQVSPKAVLNKELSYYGLGLGILLGRLR